MDSIELNYLPIIKEDKVIGFIDRTFSDTTRVKLPCGYIQKFWIDEPDEKLIERCTLMKSLKIESI